MSPGTEHRAIWPAGLNGLYTIRSPRSCANRLAGLGVYWGFNMVDFRRHDSGIRRRLVVLGYRGYSDVAW